MSEVETAGTPAAAKSGKMIRFSNGAHAELCTLAELLTAEKRVPVSLKGAAAIAVSEALRRAQKRAGIA